MLEKIAKAAVVAGGMCLVLAGCVARYSYESVEATVSDKQYTASYLTMMPVYTGKSTIMVPETQPAEYNITFSYGKVTQTFDDNAHNDKYKLKEKVQMYLRTGYDSNDKIVTEGLSFDK